MHSMILRQSVSREGGSFSSVWRRVCKRRCSSLSATCCVEKTTSTRFLPSAPERDFLSSARYISCSSCRMRPIEVSTHEMISRLEFT